jgi:hypothetical protein
MISAVLDTSLASMRIITIISVSSRIFRENFLAAPAPSPTELAVVVFPAVVVLVFTVAHIDDSPTK